MYFLSLTLLTGAKYFNNKIWDKELDIKKYQKNMNTQFGRHSMKEIWYFPVQSLISLLQQGQIIISKTRITIKKDIWFLIYIHIFFILYLRDNLLRKWRTERKKRDKKLHDKPHIISSLFFYDISVKGPATHLKCTNTSYNTIPSTGRTLHK